MKRKFDSELFSSSGVQGESALSDRELAWRRGPLLGKGGFGYVYLANLKNPNSSRGEYLPEIMAIKSAEFSVSNSLQKEKEILYNLRECPYILYCYGEEETTSRNGQIIYNILLEYASGGTLADLMKLSGGCGLAEWIVKKCARCILKGIEYIHSHGYVHCDLKPDNVLLVPAAFDNDPFVPVIADFGLAKRCSKSKRTKYDSGIGGTTPYMAPETVIDHVQEAPSDIWALGCIVYEMLTGKKVWDPKPGMTSDEVFDIPSNVPEDWKSFLKGCLERNPEVRHSAGLLLLHPLMSEESSDEGEVLDLGGFMSNDDAELFFSSFMDDWNLDSCYLVDVEVQKKNNLMMFAKPAGALQAV